MSDGSEQHGGMIREGWVIEVNLIAVTLTYNGKDMKHRTGKTRSYTWKRKDTKVTNKISADPFENEAQETQHNTAYKMTNTNADEWYELLSIRYYESLHKSCHISCSDITDKSGAVPWETQIKVAELPRRNNVNTDDNIFNETIP